MADIGVVHGPIADGGGAEAVAIQTLVALSNAGHEVTLYTTDEVEREALADRFGTAIPAEITISRIETLGVRAVDLASRLATPLGVTDFPLLRQVALERFVVRRHASEHDRLVCTHGEFAVGNAIEYVHFPYFSETAMRRYGSRFDERFYPTYHRLCRWLKRRERHSEPTTITNSRWTAEVIEETLGREATVVYPPVEVDAFDPPAWTEMEPGFVAVGRLHPLKRQHELITIVDDVRARGFDTHLHLVGAIGSQSYYRRLEKLARTRPHVHLEGELDRGELVELLETHRYGLHGRQFEHFGIVVAEMVASGSIPFVPASGGQQEIVDRASRLCYVDRAEAVAKITSVLASDDEQVELRQRLAGTASLYSPSQFRQTIQSIVEDSLTPPGSSRPV